MPAKKPKPNGKHTAKRPVSEAPDKGEADPRKTPKAGPKRS